MRARRERLRIWFSGLSPRSKAAWISAFALVLLGALALAAATNLVVALAVVVVVALCAQEAFDEAVARLLGATLIALVALAGFNVIVDRLFELPIIPGLVAALVVFTLVAAWYVDGLVWGRPWKAFAAFVLAAATIVGLPIVIGRASDKTAETRVESAVAATSALDILIVTTGKSHPLPAEIPPDDALRGFDVHFAVGVAEAGGVRWTLADTKDASAALRAIAQGDAAPEDDRAPVARPGVDAALILLVDGTAPVVEDAGELPDLPGSGGEVERWRRIARVATRTDIPAFALLQTRASARLDRWQDFTSGGTAASVQGLGSPSVVDAGVRLGIGAPESQSDYALAVQYRPILFFDTKEPVPRPLRIESLFQEGRVHLCHDERLLGTACDEAPVTDPAKLVNGNTHIRMTLREDAELRKLARDEARRARAARTPAGVPGVPPGTPPPTDTLEQALGAGSAMYVHPVSVNRDGRRLLYLDYWWYLQDNPAETGAGAFCGAGLVIPGITCHNHESDWEGITVEIDRTHDPAVVESVYYAQHDHVIRYRWTTLRTRWQARYGSFLAEVADASTRPLAFSARGTHATYPAPCGESCSQTSDGFATLGEKPHDGRLPWSGNDTSTCGEDACLKLLPTRDRGHQPALWNDFAGPWGERHCEFRYYCDSGSPPAAPGQQRRYREPWHFTKDLG